MKLINKLNSIEKIHIDKIRDIIIIEKFKDNSIEKESKFYCGCCGDVLGISKKKLKFPFSVNEFYKALIEKTFDLTVLGLYHRICGHTMFSFKNQYNFISLENYNKNKNK